MWFEDFMCVSMRWYIAIDRVDFVLLDPTPVSFFWVKAIIR